MASRVVHCARLLCLGRSLGSSYLFAHSGRTQRFRSLSRLGGGWECSGNRGHLYYNTSSGGGGEDGEGEGEEGEGEGEGENGSEGQGQEEDLGRELVQKVLHQQYALAPVAIPDVFPEVPLLPVSRNPIFPKFVKMLEVRVHLFCNYKCYVHSYQGIVM